MGVAYRTRAVYRMGVQSFYILLIDNHIFYDCSCLEHCFSDLLANKYNGEGPWKKIGDIRSKVAKQHETQEKYNFCGWEPFLTSPQGSFLQEPGPNALLVGGQKSISKNIGMLYIKLLEILGRFRTEMETYAQNQLEMS